MSDLHEVISNSISDAELAPDTPAEVTEAPETNDPTPVEPTAPPDATEPLAEVPEPPEAVTPTPVVPQDEFGKKFGIESQSPSGRENRIPYSRVKKITEKAVTDAKKEWETSNTPKYTELEGKVKDYEGRLQKVAEFEHVMINDRDRFLQMLSSIPGYSEVFQKLNQPAPIQEQQAPISDDMPSPDQRLSDGSMVYSLDGLKSLLAWNSKNVSEKVTKDITSRYAPIETEWQAHQKMQTIIPQVQRQIDEARKWPMFNENETDIVKALQEDQKISLEGAYQKVVYPRLLSDRNKMREELLKEIKAAPSSTSVPTRTSKPIQASVQTGPRSLEDVIGEAIKVLK